MAGFISRQFAGRISSAVRIVEAGGAGRHRIDGIYRESKVVCDDLQPGSYPAIAGQAIAAGATGSVVYDGTVYEAVNQSQCNVVIGDKIGLHVSPACEAFFVPCVCSCSQTDPTCCDRSIAVCVNGDVRIIPVDAGQERWTFGVGFPEVFCCSDTCGPGSYFELALQCEGTSIDAAWSFVCYDAAGLNPITTSGTLDWSALCTGPAVIEGTLTITGHDGNCSLDVVSATEATDELCYPCGSEPPPTDCCSGTRWFCIDGESVEIALDGGTHIFDVSGCCGCPGATLELELTCNNGIVSLTHKYTCDLTVEIATKNISDICDSNDPVVVDITGSCFLQVVITIVEQTCDPC
jgi:predicted RecA/RadA family phage recombinase